MGVGDDAPCLGPCPGLGSIVPGVDISFAIVAWPLARAAVAFSWVVAPAASAASSLVLSAAAAASRTGWAWGPAMSSSDEPERTAWPARRRTVVNI